LFNSCSSSHSNYTKTQVKTSKPVITATGTNTSPAAQTEREYQALSRTYKSETVQVLNSILNDASDSNEVSISVENTSRCNMVLTISGNNYFKKIPIGAGKIGTAMLPKNQNYNLSGMVCNSVYQKTKYISNSFSIKLSN